MDRKQIENLYIVNGLQDFKLRNTDDLLKTHGIDYKAVEGYTRLDDVNKRLYEKFIINYFNFGGIESRATLIPKGIYYVEDTEFLAKRDPDDDCYVVKGATVKAIDKNGLKTILHSWEDEEFKHLNTLESDMRSYLRFEYEREGEKVWQHVINESTWY